MATVDSDGTFGFGDLIRMLDPALAQDRMEKSFTKAQNKIGVTFVARARKAIMVDKIYKPNKPSTIARKGSSTPLVAQHGDLVGAITFEVKDPFRLALGISSAKLKSGRFLYEVLHNGATIRRGNSVWIIPARPFLSTIWEDPDFLLEVGKFYFEALAEAIVGGQ